MNATIRGIGDPGSRRGRAVGADEHDRPAGQPRLAVVQAVAVHLIEQKAVDRSLLEIAEGQSGGKRLGLAGLRGCLPHRRPPPTLGRR
jgi:hypothetical protein